jgi:SAM-dependent methyltransferase
MRNMAGEGLRHAGAFLSARYRGAPSAPFLVLEAGGGSVCHFPLPDGTTLVALDIDIGQLVRNATTTLRVAGDLEALPFGKSLFDMTICFNVIEHLQHPDTALESLVSTLKPHGLLVLGFPSRDSLKALVTRLTPLSFHRWYYRRVVGKKDRGDGHFDAFATVFHPLCSPPRLHSFLTQLGMEVLYEDRFDGAKDYELVRGSPLRRLFSIPFYLVTGFAWVASGGRLRLANSDVLLVALKKMGQETVQRAVAP